VAVRDLSLPINDRRFISGPFVRRRVLNARVKDRAEKMACENGEMSLARSARISRACFVYEAFVSREW